MLPPYTLLVPLKYLIPLLVGISILLVIIFLVSLRFGITLILVTIGFLMVWKTPWFLEMFGRVPWAEKHLTGGFGAGAGGSWLWYKLLGIITIVAAILYLTGILQALLTNILGVFFGSGVYD
ncbi:MAG: Uncharacterized protein G01um101438_1019 [Parcubacteria group bacterium Gr01-1014_38]|nr:MAG: Uncharacterized protein G01um101438_1019 [Parcubacteria group bacterium Gr01-1014_38]